MERSYTAAQLRQVNQTARGRGAVGSMAVVPRLVAQLSLPYDQRTVLDYGAGPTAPHRKLLEPLGWQVTAWDIGTNFRSEIHTRDALAYQYWVVMASNVLNVQPSSDLAHHLVDELFRVCMPGGVVIFNYPSEPRKCKLSLDRLLYQVSMHSNLYLNVGTKRAPVIVAVRAEIDG